MFALDVPTAAQNIPILVAQVADSRVSVPKKERAMGLCFGVSSSKPEHASAVSLAVEYAAAEYFSLYEKIKVAEPRPEEIEIVERPIHGKAIQRTYEDGTSGYDYVPDSGYVGDERIVFRATVDGTTVRLVYLLKVTNVVTDNMSNDIFCRKTGTQWKISSMSDFLPAFGTVLDAELPIVYPYIFDAMNGLFPGIELAETSGYGVSSKITLDTNAAGYGWFMDSTPDANDEFLPTSNPNEWIAKPGSKATGKMDMLSVLLHEYGHVLGIEHSTDPHDYMGTTLAPGVRRLPSADELALMTKLAGEARAALEADGGTPTDPSSPLPTSPTLPLGTSLALVLAGRLRSTRYGALSIAPDSAKLVPQYDIAANPKLANTDFNGGDGWASEGEVPQGFPSVIHFANGTATLTEDTPADIDALANDLDAHQPGFAPVVVQAPAHGMVTVKAVDRRKFLWDGSMVRDITRRPECATSEAGSPV